MSNTLEYKGYTTKVEYSAEDHVLFGKIEGIRDLVNFESETAAGIEEEFHAAVDDYLALCEETGKEPNEPCNAAKYAFPCVMTPEKDGGYSVDFPDVPQCYTCADDLPRALEMAQDVLCLRLYDMEEAGQPIPAPSDHRTIKLEGDDFVSVVACDTMDYRKRHNSRAVKKTLTIPEWLNVAAEKSGVNFSAVLQDALKRQLDL